VSDNKATHIPPGVAPIKLPIKITIRWAKMKVVEKQKKDARITIRLSKSDIYSLEQKMAEAGYKAAGAFIRDFVANNNTKPKVSSDVVQIARELMSLASMINAEKSGSELLAKVKHIAKINVGGVA
jgi:hypothetical protein